VIGLTGNFSYSLVYSVAAQPEQDGTYRITRPGHMFCHQARTHVLSLPAKTQLHWGDGEMRTAMKIQSDSLLYPVSLGF